MKLKYLVPLIAIIIAITASITLYANKKKAPSNTAYYINSSGICVCVKACVGITPFDAVGGLTPAAIIDAAGVSVELYINTSCTNRAKFVK